MNFELINDIYFGLVVFLSLLVLVLILDFYSEYIDRTRDED